MLVRLRLFPCIPAGFRPLPGYGSAEAVPGRVLLGVQCESPASRASLRLLLATRFEWEQGADRPSAATLHVLRAYTGDIASPHRPRGPHTVITRSQVDNDKGLVMLVRRDGFLCMSLRRIAQPLQVTTRLPHVADSRHRQTVLRARAQEPAGRGVRFGSAEIYSIVEQY